MRRVPNPLLFFFRQGATLFLFASHRREVYLFLRVRRNDASHRPAENLPDCRTVQVDSTLGKAVVGQVNQDALNVIGTDLTDFVTLQFLFPQLHRTAVVVHLPTGDFFLFFQTEPVIRPCGEAVALGENVKATA